jgi:hypothetical protein
MSAERPVKLKGEKAYELVAIMATAKIDKTCCMLVSISGIQLWNVGVL